jgi:hypothetical protein
MIDPVAPEKSSISWANPACNRLRRDILPRRPQPQEAVMSATNSYNFVTFSKEECFAVSRALRARTEMLMAMLNDLDLAYDPDTAVTRAYLLRQLDAARSARDSFDLVRRLGGRA